MSRLRSWIKRGNRKEKIGKSVSYFLLPLFYFLFSTSAFAGSFGGGVVSGGGGGIEQATFDAHTGDTAPHSAAAANTPSRLVLRDASGNFAAGTITATLTGAATALAANGGNCSAGQAPLGVDAAGAVEACFDVATQAELDTHAALTSTAHGAVSTNTPSTIVARDASGNFAANVATLGTGSQVTGAGLTQLFLTAPAGNSRDVVFSSADLWRWVLRTNATAESGGNAGSDLQILRRADDGTHIATTFAITRSTGEMTTESLTVPDGQYLRIGDNNAGPPAAGDCDSDLERGRISLDTTNFRLYVCMGATGSRNWDYIALTN